MDTPRISAIVSVGLRSFGHILHLVGIAVQEPYVSFQAAMTETTCNKVSWGHISGSRVYKDALESTPVAAQLDLHQIPAP